MRLRPRLTSAIVLASAVLGGCESDSVSPDGGDGGTNNSGANGQGGLSAGGNGAGGETCTEGPPMSGVTCEEAIDASCGGTFTGSTIGKDDHYQTCNVGGVFAGDQAYVIHSSIAQRFSVLVEPQAATPDYNIAIHVKRDCAKMFECLSESMIKVEDGVPGAVLSVFDLGAGETAYVIVDGVSLGVALILIMRHGGSTPATLAA